MRRLLAVFALAGLLVSGCTDEQPPAGDLDSIESTLNSVESELNEP
ncbi:MAG: hypothetical protein ABW224_14885 [Kibdelosporangium sp.]